VNDETKRVAVLFKSDEECPLSELAEFNHKRNRFYLICLRTMSRGDDFIKYYPLPSLEDTYDGPHGYLFMNWDSSGEWARESIDLFQAIYYPKFQKNTCLVTFKFAGGIEFEAIEANTKTFASETSFKPDGGPNVRISKFAFLSQQDFLDIYWPDNVWWLRGGNYLYFDESVASEICDFDKEDRFRPHNIVTRESLSSYLRAPHTKNLSPGFLFSIRCDTTFHDTPDPLVCLPPKYASAYEANLLKELRRMKYEIHILPLRDDLLERWLFRGELPIIG